MSELREYSFSETQKTEFVDKIVENAATLGAAAVRRNYGKYGIIGSENMSDAEYNELNAKVKDAMLAFSAKLAGFAKPTTKTELAMAFNSDVFRDVMNSITTRALALMMVRYDAPQISAIADIENVEVGDSVTYEIDTKALPQAQRGTYGSNVSFVPSWAKGAITLTPKVYTIGTSIDYIRIIANGYDYGAQIARVYAGMLFAQYKLVIGKIFDTSILTGTPLVQSVFNSTAYTQLASDIGMLNGGSVDGVTAFGTRVAFNSISALATTGGYTTRDQFIENGYLQKIYGVDSIILEQFTNLAAPFTTANATNLRTIPDNLIVLISTGTDKPVKLVRENYVRVKETEAKDNTLNRMEYTYFQGFDAGLATASHFGLQGTSAE